MHHARFSDEQIEETVRLADTGAPVAEIIGKLGISEATLFAWKKRVERLGTGEIRRLREENARLSQLVADLTSHQNCRTCALGRGGHRRTGSETRHAPALHAAHQL